MSVPNPRRFAILLSTLIAIVVAGLRCSTYHLPPVPEPPDYCITPAGPYWRPVVCVDETTLTATQRVTIVSDVEPTTAKSRIPSNRPVTIFWRTRQKFNLQLQFDPKQTCIDQLQCNGEGHCQATVKPLEQVNGVKQNRRCTYEILDGSKPQRTDDTADIVVQPCCW